MQKRYPITMMCAACIPWTEDFKFDEVSFRREVSHLIEGGAKSIYIFGTSGEGYSLDTAMFTQIVAVFLDACKDGEGVMPMVGIISTSMPEMIARIRLAYDLGARDFQIACPCWGELNDNDLLTFFRIVCGTFPDCRFVHYNNGPRSKTKATAAQYVRIAREVPNLVGAKYSTPNMYEIHSLAQADCPMAFYLVDGGYGYGAMVGTFGLLNSFASVDLDLAWQWFYAGQNKDYAKLVDLTTMSMRLSDALGVVNRPLMDSALDKTIERVADSRFSNKLYPPYEGLTEEEFAVVDQGMKQVLAEYRQKYQA